jgi:peptide deformylase
VKEETEVAILPIYICSEPVMRKKAKPVKEPDASLHRLAADMVETMHNAGGVGLAANQVGSLQRIIVVDLTEDEAQQQPTTMVLVNPVVVKEEGSSVMEEGCLSIPDIREEVERPERIIVRYKDLDWNDHEIEAEGFPARVMLHEIDHLNGVLFVDRLSMLKRKLLRGRLNKLRKGEMEVRYPVVSGEAVKRPADLVVR